MMGEPQLDWAALVHSRRAHAAKNYPIHLECNMKPVSWPRESMMEASPRGSAAICRHQFKGCGQLGTPPVGPDQQVLLVHLGDWPLLRRPLFLNRGDGLSRRGSLGRPKKAPPQCQMSFKSNQICPQQEISREIEPVASR